MPWEYSIRYEDSLIRVTVTGTPDYLSTDRLWHDIVANCKRHECSKILGESETEEWQEADAYDHAPIFEAAGLSRQVRIAWVEKNEEARTSIKLAEAVVRNRGFATARVFDDITEARRWLADVPDGQ